MPSVVEEDGESKYDNGMNGGLERERGEFSLVDPSRLRKHEKTNMGRVVLMLVLLMKEGVFTQPLLVDAASMTILDGHHRYAAARILGLKQIPCWCVDYFNDASVVLAARRSAVEVSKEDVVRRGMSRDLYPYKTTRHIYEVPSLPPFTLHELRMRKK